MNIDILPKNKFICNFQSRHLCLEKYSGMGDYWITQYQKRFILADNIDAAKEYFIKHFQDELFWPKGLHEMVSMRVDCYPSSEAQDQAAGYNRFATDIRTDKSKQEITNNLLSIKQKIDDYLRKNP